MCRSVVISTIIMFITAALPAESETNYKPVYFSLIYSGGENGFNSTGGIPALDIALEAVRNQQLLEGYDLTYDTPRNSKV